MVPQTLMYVALQRRSSGMPANRERAMSHVSVLVIAAMAGSLTCSYVSLVISRQRATRTVAARPSVYTRTHSRGSREATAAMPLMPAAILPGTRPAEGP